MSTIELAAYLKTLRDGNVMSAVLKLGNGVELHAVFAPEPVPTVGEPLDKERAAGAWKTWASPGDDE